jgi:hypothetical protein
MQAVAWKTLAAYLLQRDGAIRAQRALYAQSSGQVNATVTPPPPSVALEQSGAIYDSSSFAPLQHTPVAQAEAARPDPSRHTCSTGASSPLRST